jgi:penicillin amidase
MQRLQEKLASLDGLREMILGPVTDVDEVGSNNWVVGPSLTVDGNALLSNDPHLGMTNPATWYLGHLDAVTNGTGEIHAAGATFAGLPWVIVGQNASIAWGVTTTNMDFSDVYIETLTDDGNGVVFRGNDVPFTRVPFLLEFSDGTTEQRELLFVPHHGPVRELDEEAGTAITLRWTGNDLDTDINVLTDLARAATTEEARQALLQVTTIGQNWVVIDSENNIGWYPYNRLPKRAWATDLAGDAPAWLPLDGSSGDYEWEEYFAIEELPQATNPGSGYIATANNDMTGALFDEDPTTLPTGMSQPPYQSDVAAGFRHAQIVNLIEGVGDQHTRATMDAIVSDIYSLIGERMVPGMIEIAEDAQTTPGINGLKVINALKAWDFTCPTGLDGTNADDSPLVSDAGELLASSGCTAFHTLMIELRTRIEDGEDAPSGRKPSVAAFQSIANHEAPDLVAGDVYWDNPTTPEVETKFQVMSAALQQIGDFLDGQLGQDETRWPWGRLHGLVLQSDLSSLSSVFQEFDNPPPGESLFANDGGLFTVDVANPLQQQGREYIQTAGPSTRFVCETSSTGPSCTIQLPGGQSGDINSPHYEDLLPGWLANEPLPLVFDIAEAAANATETISY